MEILVRILYLVSTSLMVPVIAALLLLLAWTALHLGGLVREGLERRRGRKILGKILEELKAGRGVDVLAPGGFLSGEAPAVGGLPGAFLGVLAEEEARDPVLLGKAVDDLQLEMEGRLGRVGTGVRLGPMLGLMGTLIPMGPALTGLASGNVEAMSRNLVVAFSTTVLGLLVGGACYMITVIRGRWYARDLSDIEFLHDLALKKEEEHREIA